VQCHTTLLNTRQLFIMHDQLPSIAGTKAVTLPEAVEWNERGYGVFWVINDFVGDRLSQNLQHINAWFFEIDDLPKSEQWLLIEQGLIPSLIVESKNSLHVYFFARKASRDSFDEVQGRVIHFYGSDPKIKDPLRLMRAPGFNHLKNPQEPYPVRVVWSSDVTYTPDMMRYFFSQIPQGEAIFKEDAPARVALSPEAKQYFASIFEHNQMELLKALSGTKWVKGEVYSFKPQNNGKYNIHVNGNSTHCFIDAQGKIGAVNGGPTIWQWLKWFGHKPEDIKQAIKEVVGLC